MLELDLLLKVPDDIKALLFTSSDNVELVLDSPATPESGTASVRARPTVKHHAVSISVRLHGTTPLQIFIIIAQFVLVK